MSFVLAVQTGSYRLTFPPAGTEVICFEAKMNFRTVIRLIDQLMGWRSRWSKSVSVGTATQLEWRRLRNVSGNQLRIGNDSIINATITFEAKSGIVSIGDRCFIGRSDIVCYRRIQIGNDVIISWGVTLVDHDSHGINWEDRRNDVAEWARGRKYWNNVAHGQITIEDKVWIGFDVSILKGVTIGEGAVVGACSVVTKDVAPYTIVAGNPARVIRNLKDPDGSR
jgi:acetyltransferase-like isoleucine patch superfamily enzyme